MNRGTETVYYLGVWVVPKAGRPRILKYTASLSDPEPSAETVTGWSVRTIGLGGFNEGRGDKFYSEAVSEILWNAVDGEWVRPWLAKPKSETQS